MSHWKGPQAFTSLQFWEYWRKIMKLLLCETIKPLDTCWFLSRKCVGEKKPHPYDNSNVSWNMGLEMVDDAYLCFHQLHITFGSASSYIQMNYDWKREGNSWGFLRDPWWIPTSHSILTKSPRRFYDPSHDNSNKNWGPHRLRQFPANGMLSGPWQQRSSSSWELAPLERAVMSTRLPV